MYNTQLFSLQHKNKVMLFGFGFLILFLELSLIRYLAGNIWNLGYFPNLVLISTFLGMGIGFTFHHNFSKSIANYFVLFAAAALLLLVIIVSFNQIVVPGFVLSQSNYGSILFFTQTIVTTPYLFDLATFCICFLLVVLINFFITVKMAKLFAEFKPLHAYTLDIIGSCAGIALFSLMSFLQAPAFYWFIILAVFFVLFAFVEKKKSWLYFFAIFAVLVIIVQNNDHRFNGHKYSDKQLITIWSPYQKVQYNKKIQKIYANNIPHQMTISKKVILNSFYSIPYTMRQKLGLDKVNSTLILGAGTGNDVVSAILHNVDSIDAVEIDPVIARIGKTYNKLRPYQNPKVHLHITDGREFLAHTKKHFGLIIFALTDSVVRASSMSQLRLENYLFTYQSLQRAYSLLNPDGQIYLYNYYRQPWIAEKIERMLFKITGHYPKVLKLTNQFYVLSIGKKPSTYQSTPSFSKFTTKISSDNWPFLYLKSPAIPSVYLAPMFILTMLVIGLLYLHQRNTRHKRQENILIKVAFLTMGMAFLLLESKGIIQFSLLFGNTWFNNSLVFFAVLVLILLANWLAYLLPSKLTSLAYALLVIVSISVSFMSVEHMLTIQSVFARFISASLIIFSPIFFANLVFGLSFKNRILAEHVFGWNLLGAVFGGILEYSSMLFGYQALSLLAAFLYIASFACFYFGVKRIK